MRTDVLTALKILSVTFKEELTEELQIVWEYVLADLSPQEIDCAVMAYLKSGKNQFFPRPGQIYELARPLLDLDSEAGLIADNVFTALRSYGVDLVGVARTKLKVGEIGWQYIELQGGWHMFVKSVTSESDIPILKAQARRSILHLLGKNKRGTSTESKTVLLEQLGVKMRELK